MSITRNSHYVPQWYQEQFFEDGGNTLHYLNLYPELFTLPNGQTKPHKAKFQTPTSRAFAKYDLYSTFFGTSVNDEIERKLFGDIDTSGSKAVRAFIGDDVREWHRHFQTFFAYMDIQKIRTPKGLDWVRESYPTLTQNELMSEMQGIRMMHCTIWTECVREIVSAEDARVKFIVSDHPVTMYNHALPPDHKLCAYPNDPAISLKASQTIFPLNREFCLILTNLEYAQEPGCSPLEKRTFARNFRSSLTRVDKFIRSRKLSDGEVAQINFILKTRAKQFVAAGREEWLYPEVTVNGKWADLRESLLPKDGLYHFGGEIYARYNDGHVHYQDAFGRTEKPGDHLLKSPSGDTLAPKQACGCGAPKRFRDCCEPIPVHLRPTWSEKSIRERNLILFRMIADTLDFEHKDWTQIRRDLTDDQIKKVYEFYQVLWPLDTDLLKLLPKPDGRSRAVYSGLIHPQAIVEFALGSSIYFGELMIQSPFVHARAVAKEYSPVEHPKACRAEFLKAVMAFMTLMPLVEIGVINLIPDPCDFDYHLREQMMHMAEARSPLIEQHIENETRAREIIEEDYKRTIMTGPEESLHAIIEKTSPEIGDELRESVISLMKRRREANPLALLQEDSLVGGESGGQLTMMRMVPNFEIAMYLAQATGAFIITDSPTRWAELRTAVRRTQSGPAFTLDAVRRGIAGSNVMFPSDTRDILTITFDTSMTEFPPLMRDIFKYLTRVSERGVKANVEASLAARFARAKSAADKAMNKLDGHHYLGRVLGLFPTNGIQHNHVNRLLLMSSSDHHMQNVPMAFFIERPPSASAPQPAFWAQRSSS